MTELAQLAEAVTTYVGRAAEKLRAQASEAGAVYVMLRTNRFLADEPQYSANKILVLAEPSADTRRLAKAALHGLRRLYRPGYRYAKAGIMLLDLVPARQRQPNLWSDPGRAAQGQRLMGVMDRINHHYGRDTIRFASAGLDPRWAMRQANRSPRYTTRWDELPIARC